MGPTPDGSPVLLATGAFRESMPSMRTCPEKTLITGVFKKLSYEGQTGDGPLRGQCPYAEKLGVWCGGAAVSALGT
jgi:hypothetical protein